MDPNDSIAAGNQLREEISRAILRSGEESDITVYEVLGVIEIVKADIIERLERIKRPEQDEPPTT